MTILRDSLARDLIAAAGAGDVEKVRLLLDAGVDPAYWPRCDAPALHHAVEAASVEVVRELLLRGCPPDLRDAVGQTAFGTVIHELGERPDESTAAKLKEIGELLLERGVSPTAPVDWEHTALSLAREYRRPDLENWLTAHVKRS